MAKSEVAPAAGTPNETIVFTVRSTSRVDLMSIQKHSNSPWFRAAVRAAAVAARELKRELCALFRRSARQVFFA